LALPKANLDGMATPATVVDFTFPWESTKSTGLMNLYPIPLWLVGLRGEDECTGGRVLGTGLFFSMVVD
jgi:hypothetical protein